MIRPLIYASEREIAEFSAEKAFPIIPCDLCGSQEHLQRKQVKSLLDRLDAENPHVRANVFASLANVRPTHLFDTELRRALGLFEGPTHGETQAVDAAPIPTRIVVFADNLALDFPDPEDFADQVKITVLHELGHYFGLDEDDMVRLGLD